MMSANKVWEWKSPILAFLIVCLLVVLGARNSQLLFRMMVNQEMRLSTASYATHTTEHFEIKYLPQDEAHVNMIARASEDAFVKVGSIFQREAPGRTTMVIYPDGGTLARSFGWERDAKAMGVYWGGTIRLLSPGVWMPSGAEEEVFFQEGPVYHEFAHLMVDEITRGNYSRWLTEGIAQHVEKEVTGFEFASPALKPAWTRLYTLDEMDRNFDKLDESLAYWESLKIVEYIVMQYGEHGWLNLLAALGTGLPMDQAVEKTLNIDYRSFESQLMQALENDWVRGGKI